MTLREQVVWLVQNCPNCTSPSICFFSCFHGQPEDAIISALERVEDNVLERWLSFHDNCPHQSSCVEAGKLVVDFTG